MPEESRYDYISSLVTQIDNDELEQDDAVTLIEDWDKKHPYDPEEVEKQINQPGVVPGKPLSSMEETGVAVELGDMAPTSEIYSWESQDAEKIVPPFQEEKITINENTGVEEFDIQKVNIRPADLTLTSFNSSNMDMLQLAAQNVITDEDISLDDLIKEDKVISQNKYDELVEQYHLDVEQNPDKYSLKDKTVPEVEDILRKQFFLGIIDRDELDKTIEEWESENIGTIKEPTKYTDEHGNEIELTPLLSDKEYKKELAHKKTLYKIETGFPLTPKELDNLKSRGYTIYYPQSQKERNYLFDSKLWTKQYKDGTSGRSMLWSMHSQQDFGDGLSKVNVDPNEEVKDYTKAFVAPIVFAPNDDNDSNPMSGGILIGKRDAMDLNLYNTVKFHLFTRGQVAVSGGRSALEGGPENVVSISKVEGGRSGYTTTRKRDKYGRITEVIVPPNKNEPYKSDWLKSRGYKTKELTLVDGTKYTVEWVKDDENLSKYWNTKEEVEADKKLQNPKGLVAYEFNPEKLIKQTIHSNITSVAQQGQFIQGSDLNPNATPTEYYQSGYGVSIVDAIPEFRRYLMEHPAVSGSIYSEREGPGSYLDPYAADSPLGKLLGGKALVSDVFGLGHTYFSAFDNRKDEKEFYKIINGVSEYLVDDKGVMVDKYAPYRNAALIEMSVVDRAVNANTIIAEHAARGETITLQEAQKIQINQTEKDIIQDLPEADYFKTVLKEDGSFWKYERVQGPVDLDYLKEMQEEYTAATNEKDRNAIAAKYSDYVEPFLATKGWDLNVHGKKNVWVVDPETGTLLRREEAEVLDANNEKTYLSIEDHNKALQRDKQLPTDLETLGEIVNEKLWKIKSAMELVHQNLPEIKANSKMFQSTLWNPFRTYLDLRKDYPEIEAISRMLKGGDWEGYEALKKFTIDRDNVEAMPILKMLGEALDQYQIATVAYKMNIDPLKFEKNTFTTGHGEAWRESLGIPYQTKQEASIDYLNLLDEKFPKLYQTIATGGIDGVSLKDFTEFASGYKFGKDLVAFEKIALEFLITRKLTGRTVKALAQSWGGLTSKSLMGTGKVGQKFALLEMMILEEAGIITIRNKLAENFTDGEYMSPVWAIGGVTFRYTGEFMSSLLGKGGKAAEKFKWYRDVLKETSETYKKIPFRRTVSQPFKFVGKAYSGALAMTAGDIGVGVVDIASGKMTWSDLYNHTFDVGELTHKAALVMAMGMWVPGKTGRTTMDNIYKDAVNFRGNSTVIDGAAKTVGAKGQNTIFGKDFSNTPQEATDNINKFEKEALSKIEGANEGSYKRLKNAFGKLFHDGQIQAIGNYFKGDFSKINAESLKGLFKEGIEFSETQLKAIERIAKEVNAKGAISGKTFLEMLKVKKGANILRGANEAQSLIDTYTKEDGDGNSIKNYKEKIDDFVADMSVSTPELPFSEEQVLLVGKGMNVEMFSFLLKEAGKSDNEIQLYHKKFIEAKEINGQLREFGLNMKPLQDLRDEYVDNQIQIYSVNDNIKELKKDKEALENDVTKQKKLNRAEELKEELLNKQRQIDLMREERVVEYFTQLKEASVRGDKVVFESTADVEKYMTERDDKGELKHISEEELKRYQEIKEEWDIDPEFEGAGATPLDAYNNMQADINLLESGIKDLTESEKTTLKDLKEKQELLVERYKGADISGFRVTSTGRAVIDLETVKKITDPTVIIHEDLHPFLNELFEQQTTRELDKLTAQESGLIAQRDALLKKKSLNEGEKKKLSTINSSIADIQVKKQTAPDAVKRQFIKEFRSVLWGKDAKPSAVYDIVLERVRNHPEFRENEFTDEWLTAFVDVLVRGDLDIMDTDLTEMSGVFGDFIVENSPLKNVDLSKDPASVARFIINYASQIRLSEEGWERSKVEEAVFQGLTNKNAVEDGAVLDFQAKNKLKEEIGDKKNDLTTIKNTMLTARTEWEAAGKPLSGIMQDDAYKDLMSKSALLKIQIKTGEENIARSDRNEKNIITYQDAIKEKEKIEKSNKKLQALKKQLIELENPKTGLRNDQKIKDVRDQIIAIESIEDVTQTRAAQQLLKDNAGILGIVKQYYRDNKYEATTNISSARFNQLVDIHVMGNIFRSWNRNDGTPFGAYLRETLLGKNYKGGVPLRFGSILKAAQAGEIKTVEIGKDIGVAEEISKIDEDIEEVEVKQLATEIIFREKSQDFKDEVTYVVEKSLNKIDLSTAEYVDLGKASVTVDGKEVPISKVVDNKINSYINTYKGFTGPRARQVFVLDNWQGMLDLIPDANIALTTEGKPVTQTTLGIRNVLLDALFGPSEGRAKVSEIGKTYTGGAIIEGQGKGTEIRTKIDISEQEFYDLLKPYLENETEVVIKNGKKVKVPTKDNRNAKTLYNAMVNEFSKAALNEVAREKLDDPVYIEKIKAKYGEEGVTRAVLENFRRGIRQQIGWGRGKTLFSAHKKVGERSTQERVLDNLRATGIKYETEVEMEQVVTDYIEAMGKGELYDFEYNRKEEFDAIYWATRTEAERIAADLNQVDAAKNFTSGIKNVIDLNAEIETKFGVVTGKDIINVSETVVPIVGVKTLGAHEADLMGVEPGKYSVVDIQALNDFQTQINSLSEHLPPDIGLTLRNALLTEAYSTTGAGRNNILVKTTGEGGKIEFMPMAEYQANTSVLYGTKNQGLKAGDAYKGIDLSPKGIGSLSQFKKAGEFLVSNARISEKFALAKKTFKEEYFENRRKFYNAWAGQQQEWLFESKNETEFNARLRTLMYIAKHNTNIEMGDRQFISGIDAVYITPTNQGIQLGKGGDRYKLEHQKSSLEQSLAKIKTIATGTWYERVKWENGEASIYDMNDWRLTKGGQTQEEYKGVYALESKLKRIDEAFGKTSTIRSWRFTADFADLNNYYTLKSIHANKPQTLQVAITRNVLSDPTTYPYTKLGEKMSDAQIAKIANSPEIGSEIMVAAISNSKPDQIGAKVAFLNLSARKKAYDNNKNNLSEVVPGAGKINYNGINGTVEASKITDKAYTNANSVKKDGVEPITKIYADFDFTSHLTGNIAILTNPHYPYDVVEVKAKDFPTEGEKLIERGYMPDFSGYKDVIGAEEGPMADNIRKVVEEHKDRTIEVGDEEFVNLTGVVQVVTARGPESAESIQKSYMDIYGVYFDIENIRKGCLGGGKRPVEPADKQEFVMEDLNDLGPMFMVEEYANKEVEAAKFWDDDLMQIEGMKSVFDQLDWNGKVQQAKVLKFSSQYRQAFELQLEEAHQVPVSKVYGGTESVVAGKGKGKLKFVRFASMDAVDLFVYQNLPKGKSGEETIKWWNENIFSEYGAAQGRVNAWHKSSFNNVKALGKQYAGVKKTLKKKGAGVYDREDTMRMWLWNKQGMSIPGITEHELKQVNEYMENNPELKAYAQELQQLQKGSLYPKPTETWLSGNVKKDMWGFIQGELRTKEFELYNERIEAIFTPEVMNKLRAIHGENYIEAIESMMYRMKTGKSRGRVTGKWANRLMNWTNGAIGTTMWNNTKSGFLQTLSLPHYFSLGGPNNIIKAGQKMANMPRFISTFATMMNSPNMKMRGAAGELYASEMLEQAQNGGWRSAYNFVLGKVGKTANAAGDRLTIGVGGSTQLMNFYESYAKKSPLIVNKVEKILAERGKDDITNIKRYNKEYNKVLNEVWKTDKEGFWKAYDNILKNEGKDWQAGTHKDNAGNTPDLAAKQAFDNAWMFTWDETNRHQQSLDPSKLSQEQTESVIGRMALTYTNAPAQNFRNMRKAYRRLRKGIGDPKENLGQLIWYSTLNNIIFTAAQQAIFSWLPGDAPDDKKQEKYFNWANGVADTFLRSSGLLGATLSMIKNVGIEAFDQSNKNLPKYRETYLKGFDLFPPIKTKIQEFRGAGQTIDYNRKQIEEEGYMSTPGLEATSKIFQGVFNIPSYKIYKKTNNMMLSIEGMDVNENPIDIIERIALGIGYSPWDLDIETKPDEYKGRRRKTKKGGYGTPGGAGGGYGGPKKSRGGYGR